MDIDIKYRPAHTMARVHLGLGETVVAEAGSMVGMSHNIEMKTSAGGFKKGLKRLFGGESFFRNEFTPAGGPGEVLLAPALCGDMAVLDIGMTSWFVQSSSYIACNPQVEINTRVGGFKTFFGGEGIFVLRASGQGQLLVGAFGAMEKVEVEGSLIVDTGHLVAWPDSPDLQFRVTKASSGWIKSFLSGEGLVCEFTGNGSIWIQTRNPVEYGMTVGPLLPPRSN